MLREEKILKLIKKGLVYGNTNDDENLVQWIATCPSDYFEGGSENAPDNFSIVQYKFCEGGCSVIIGKDPQGCCNGSTMCEEVWDHIDYKWLDYLLLLEN